MTVNHQALRSVLEAHVRQAHTEVVLCAPYAKLSVINRLLACVQPDVRITVITRWRPDEVAAGVSDPQIRGPIVARSGVVLLHDRLHAKLYRADERVLVGSANLTEVALGYRDPANVELLADAPLDGALEVERRIRSEAITATEKLELSILAAAEAIGFVPPPSLNAVEPESAWTPQLRLPSDLYRGYRSGVANFSSTSASATSVDLAMLDVPAGLSEPAFRVVVGSRLLQNPLIRELDEFLAEPRRFGEVRTWLGSRLEIDTDAAGYSWQTTMRWLLHFLPDRYERVVPNWSEMFRRKEGI